MIGGASRIVGVALAILLAVALAACGGDDDTTAPPPSNGDQATARGEEGSSPKEKSGSPSRAEGEKGKRPAAADGPAGADVEPAPLRVSGGGSGQFRVKGGDNSIQNWGEEDEGELAAAAEALHGFYIARAEQDWAKACSYLAKSMVERLQQFAAQSKQAGKKDCEAVLEALTPPLSPAVRRESTVVDAGSLRVGEESSFLIYRGADRIVYAMPLENEDGAWKLTLIAPTALG